MVLTLWECSSAMVGVGKAWTSDYGNPKDPHDFDFIHPLSPLHNIPTDRVLPPTILLTADRACCSARLSRGVDDFGIITRR